MHHRWAFTVWVINSPHSDLTLTLLEVNFSLIISSTFSFNFCASFLYRSDELALRAAASASIGHLHDDFWNCCPDPWSGLPWLPASFSQTTPPFFLHARFLFFPRFLVRAVDLFHLRLCSSNYKYTPHSLFCCQVVEWVFDQEPSKAAFARFACSTLYVFMSRL